MSKGMKTEKELLNMTSNSSRIQRMRRRFGEGSSKSDSENSNANTIEESRTKRKRYQRHTPEQILEMEAFFTECSHPNKRQRIKLSNRLGIEPMQVKFWFQNKRTQLKAQQGIQENNQLQAEIENLRAEILRLKEALNNPSCPHCGVPTPGRETSFHEHQPGLENSNLRQEMEHISPISTKTVPTSTETTSSTQNSGSENFKAIYTDLWSPMKYEGGMSAEVDLARSAMEELMRVAQSGEPLWIRNMDQHPFVLNEKEYLRAFSGVFGHKRNGFKFEASRENVVVPMCAANISEILMNVENWANVFSGVVSRATTLQVISAGLDGTCNEAILEVNAEFQVPTPLIPTRESHFLRYCRRHVNGIWAVVDVSSDHLRTTLSVTCRRRPSGCLIQDLSNGHSKVIWVEHVEVEDEGIHSIYKPLITSGLAFGARRWVSILDGYCQRLVRAYSTEVFSQNANNFLAENRDGRRNILKLAQRMVTRFCRVVNTSIVNTWKTLPGNGNESVRFMTRTNVNDPSMPFGDLLTVATSCWLPIPPKRVYDYLCDDNTRKEWDMLLNGGNFEEMAHVVSGREEFNSVKLYQLMDVGSSPSKMIMLQESRSDPTASFVVYAPIDVACANKVLGGKDSRQVPLLPSGFAILPDGPIGHGKVRGMLDQADTGGSLLTITLQILIGSTPNATHSEGSVHVASKLMHNSVEKIKNALIPNHG